MCVHECVCVLYLISPTSSWLCHGKLPLFLFQSLMVLRERLQFAFFFSPSSLAQLCLGFVNRSLLMWPAVLPRNSPLAQPALSTSVLQSAGRRKTEWSRLWRMGRRQACSCVFVHVCMRGRPERHLQQSQGRSSSVTCAKLMFRQPKQSHLCEVEVSKRRDNKALGLISFFSCLI